MSITERAIRAKHDMQLLRKTEPSNPWSWAEGTFIPHVEHGFRAVFDREIECPSVRLLDLGCGADFSQKGYMPLLCRHVATIPVELSVGVDKDPNNSQIQDVYHHIQMKIDPNDEEFPKKILFKLKERGVEWQNFNVITSFSFAEVSNPSPELISYLIENPVINSLDGTIFALMRQRNFLHLHTYWKENFKTRVIQWAFELLENDGILLFGADDMLYRKQGNYMTCYANLLNDNVGIIERIEFK